jgi:nitroimidazol reductase NimA-like FMN-containing flavoprotein (pyridoxamine 5'-phosphate oxidase superfamily)/ribosomal protein S18 acetylase RimI-like enzyme
MRKESYFRASREAALALLARAPVVHFASTRRDGEPVLRAAHSVLLDGALYFHGSPVGEKTECLGRAAVAQAEEKVCSIPSWFLDEEHGTPASTFYRSAQAHGVLEEVPAPAEKARVLQAFMEKFQPEGRCARVEPGPVYDADLDRTLVSRLVISRVDGKEKLGQNRPPAELHRILEQLWARGDAEDPAAIDAIRDGNPSLEDPPLLATALGVRLRCALGRDACEEVADLLGDAPWLRGWSRDRVCEVHRRASAWIGARGPEGELVGSARAVSDGEEATVADLVVAPQWRNLGIGKCLLRLLLDHPAVRPARLIRLRTADAQGLFERFGFLLASFHRRASDPLEMVLERER